MILIIITFIPSSPGGPYNNKKNQSLINMYGYIYTHRLGYGQFLQIVSEKKLRLPKLLILGVGTHPVRHMQHSTSRFSLDKKKTKSKQL